MQHFSLLTDRFFAAFATNVRQKTPVLRPTSEFCYSKNKPFFKEKAALPD